MPKQEWSFFMPAEDHRQVKWLAAYVRSRFTPWGQIILAISVFCLAIASVGTQISAYLLLSFILALFITSFLLSLFFRPQVSAHRILPPPPNAGEHCTYKVIVKNLSKHPLRNLTITEQCLPHGIYPHPHHPQYNNTVEWLNPGEQATLTLAFRTPRRGIFELTPMIAGNSFPSGIIRSTRRAGNHEKFIVYPKIFQPPNLDIHVQQKFQPGGISQSSRIGTSNEFASTREYRDGDRLRDIHWRSSSKTNKLIVKEYIEEYFVRIGIFMDTELNRFEKHRCFEDRISLCAGTMHQLNESNYIIDFFINDEQNQHIQIGHGINRFNQLLEFLSAIEGNQKPEFKTTLIQLNRYASQFSILIIFLKDWDEQRAHFVEMLKKQGFNIKCIIVRDKKTTLKTTDNVTIHTTQDIEALS